MASVETISKLTTIINYSGKSSIALFLWNFRAQKFALTEGDSAHVFITTANNTIHMYKVNYANSIK